MCTPQCIFEKLGGLAFDEAFKTGKYVVRYAKNLKNLQDEMRDLDHRREDIETKVCEASDRGEEIKVEVKNWQTKVDELKEDVDRLMGQSTARENMLCITCSCPNIRWRYKLSKQAEENIVKANKLTNTRFEEISHPKPRPPEFEFLSDNNYVNFDSRASILKYLTDALKDSNVNMIGVYGLGGVGKTTLVKEVGDKMRQDGTFKQVAIAAVSKDLNVKEVQSKLAESLNLKLKATTDDQEGRRTELWNKLKNGDKYLVILDDIWEMVDLKKIGIPISDGKIGCKVVLTSRKEDLLRITMKADRNFRIAELSEAEAWDLFKKKVGNSIESQPEIYPLACELCRKCNGLPLALNALGTALQDKPEYTWKNASDKVKRYMLTQIEGIDPGVIATLRVSYDMLRSSDAQSCFLLCCLFAEDAEIPIDELTRHSVARCLLALNPRTLDEARNAVCTVVDVLKSASLLTTGSHENVVKIHDVIRDVGISISRDEKAFLIDHGALRWPENPKNGSSYSTISLNFKNIKGLPGGLVYPQLYTLMVDSSELSDLEVPDNFFNGMTQLTVLSFTKMRMRRLPSSLAKLKYLRMLNLNGCELEDIAILKDLNLEVLSLRGSKIKALPPEIAQLTSLRLFDLRDCLSLREIPQGIISNLTNLEELFFPDKFDQWEAIIDKKKEGTNSISKNMGLEELRHNGQLTTLHIFIPNVMLLPKDGLKFENLKRFRISVGSNFEWDENIPGTRFLKHKGSSLRSEFTPLVDKAEALSLIGITGLKKMLHDRGVGNGFPDLRYLKVESCDDDLEYFLGEPKSSMQSLRLHPLQSFNKLNRLVIGECKLRYLFTPTAARGLVHLEQLRVRSCEIMEAIVGFEGQNDENELIGDVMFSKLKELFLEELPNLKSFYAEKEKTQTTTGSASAHLQPLFSNKVVLPILERLKIEALDSIEEIWDKQSPSVNQETTSFGQLRDMTVRKCKKLMNLVPSNILPQLRNLQFLKVEDCPNVEFVVFKNKNGEEEAADDSTLIIPRLRRLAIHNMKKLKSFYSSSTASNAQSLFNHQVIFPVLETLRIEVVGNVIEIWDKLSITVFEAQGSFCQLMNLEVRDCNKLMHLFPSKMHPLLNNLKKLDVRRCETMEGVVGFEGEVDEDGLRNEQVCFSKLTLLSLKELPKLVSFCTKMGEAGTTEGNPSIHAQPLFNGKVAFPVLEDIVIKSVPMITGIWVQQPLSKPEKEVESFCKLKSINVWYCAQLEYILPSYMLPQLHNLLNLDIQNCKELEVIVSNKLKEKEATNNDILVFPQLKTLQLIGLDKLKCFCTGGTDQLLFSHKVVFPALEVLSICFMPHITEIWDEKPEKEIDSFSKLATIDVFSCDQLVYVLPSYMLPRLQNLQKLEIRRCKEVEVIVSKELKEKEGTDNDPIVFSQLEAVVFAELPKLKSFYTGTQLLFSKKVAFPALERLYIDHLPNITEIWDKKPLSEPEQEIESFSKLETISITKCHQLVYVLPSYMLPRLQNLQKLEIRECREVEVIVSKELQEKEAADNDTIVFSQLMDVVFAELPKLKSFYTGTQLIFSNKVAFPTLEHFTITKVPKIKEIWDKQPLPKPEKKPKSFYKLMSICVDECDQLAYVFPSYMLPQLQNLKQLRIANCKEMEVIISNTLKEKEVTNNDIILFAELKTVILQNLPKLKRLCAEMQLAFSNKDAFPVLEINIKELTSRDYLELEYYNTSCIDPDLTFLVDGTSRKEIHSELKTREEKKNEMAVEHPMKIDSSFNNSSIQMNGSTDHVNSDFTLNRGSPSGSGSREAGNSGLRGLDNLGNTCFMNTAIQCLVHTSELVDHFEDYQKDIINTEESSGMKGELAFQFEDLLRKLRASEAGPVSPEEFKSKLVAIDPRFNDGNQHDSQEFLAFLLNELHGDLNRATCKPIEAIDVEGRPDEAESNKHWSNHLSCNTSIIADLFHGQCQSKLVCPVCETKSSTFERFQDLSLPLPPTESESDTITLDQCLQTYLQEEILGQKDEWNCPHCKTDQPANKKLHLWRLPKILIIHLKRFSNNKKKLETFVDFPIDDFDLSGIVRNSQQSHHYVLYAVINHYGVMGGGHYTASVQHEGDQWYKFDDSRVSPVAKHQIKSSAAYVLFYRRKEDV